MVFKAFTFTTLLIALVLNDCGQNEDVAEAPPPQGEPFSEAPCMSGTLVTESADCPVFRTHAGDLFTLRGGIEGYTSGERVCICGTPAEASACQPKKAVELTFLGPACP